MYLIIISFDLAVASAESQRDRLIAIRSFVATAVSQRDLRSIAIRPFSVTSATSYQPRRSINQQRNAGTDNCADKVSWQRLYQNPKYP